MEENYIYLLKSPLGSVKTFLGDLFIEFLNAEKENEIEKIVKIFCLFDTEYSIPNILKKLECDTFDQFCNIMRTKKYYIIVDEAQLLYHDKYAEFWGFVKKVSETTNLSIRILCLAVYYGRRAPNIPKISIIVFQNKLQSLDFLRLNDEEMHELSMSYNKNKREDEGLLIITPDLEKLIIEETHGHVEQTILAILELQSKFKKDKIPDVEKIRLHFYSVEYSRKVIANCKACLEKLEIDQFTFGVLKEIAFDNCEIFHHPWALFMKSR